MSLPPSANSCDSYTLRSGDRHSLKVSKRRGTSKGISHEKLKKSRPPIFDGTDVAGPIVEAWLLGMERYFKIQDYIENEKAWITIFNLHGRSLIWWEHLVQVFGIEKWRIDWSQF